MTQAVRAFHIVGDQFVELDALPEALPPTGYLWVASARPAFEAEHFLEFLMVQFEFRTVPVVTSAHF